MTLIEELNEASHKCGEPNWKLLRKAATELERLEEVLKQRDREISTLCVEIRANELSLGAKDEALKQHHNHHQESLVVYFEQDGKPIDITTDLGEAYIDSDLFIKTHNTLSTAPSELYEKVVSCLKDSKTRFFQFGTTAEEIEELLTLLGK